GYWITDGTAEGTFPLLDPRGAEIARFDSQSIAFKNHLVFTEPSAEYDNQPCYVWDGTGAAARQLENLSCSYFLAAKNRLYFSGFQPQTGEELWVLENQ